VVNIKKVVSALRNENITGKVMLFVKSVSNVTEVLVIDDKSHDNKVNQVKSAGVPVINCIPSAPANIDYR